MNATQSTLCSERLEKQLSARFDVNDFCTLKFSRNMIILLGYVVTCMQQGMGKLNQGCICVH